MLSEFNFSRFEKPYPLSATGVRGNRGIEHGVLHYFMGLTQSSFILE